MELIDAIERNREYPTTFQIPTVEDIAKLMVDDFVKIGSETHGERFWVVLSKIHETRFDGIIDNDVQRIPLKLGDSITFEAKHIINILPRDEAVTLRSKLMEIEWIE